MGSVVIQLYAGEGAPSIDLAWVVKLVVTGGSLTRRPKRSLHCLLVRHLTT